jgi:hypothetical protein
VNTSSNSWPARLPRRQTPEQDFTEVSQALNRALPRLFHGLAISQVYAEHREVIRTGVRNIQKSSSRIDSQRVWRGIRRKRRTRHLSQTARRAVDREGRHSIVLKVHGEQEFSQLVAQRWGLLPVVKGEPKFGCIATAPR